MHDGNYIVTYESIIPNLRTLRNYKPLIQEFMAEGIFDSRDKRYYRLINPLNTFGTSSTGDVPRVSHPRSMISADILGQECRQGIILRFDHPFRFQDAAASLAAGRRRMSMAHGIESRACRSLITS